jgi:alpha-1,3-mannosylglycoprotein beta-1,4-N-acetylglucosaminyltransferase A/B
VSESNWNLGDIMDASLRFVIDFSQRGFIGKLFRSSELPWMIQFMLMFYNDKPGNVHCEHQMAPVNNY